PLQADEFPELSGPYFGQVPPGTTAVMFAPDLVSKTGRYEFALSFAPGGDRLLFTVQDSDEVVQVLHSRLAAGLWTEPEPVSLAHGRCKDEMEAFFAPDGDHVFFAPYNDGLDVRIWQVEVAGDDWLDPYQLTGPIADAPAFFPTCSLEGTLYYTNIVEKKVYRAWPTDAGDWLTEPLGLAFGGHAFMAPDESFVLVDGRAEDSLGMGDIYVAFSTADGGWTTPVNLGVGVNSVYPESCPSLSADGKYLLFSRYDEPGEVAQIYWVDAAVIEAARPKVDQPERALVEQAVYHSIAWAIDKDRPLLEGLIAHDEDYFSYHPHGLDPVHGYEEFTRGFDTWMDDRFEATRTEVREFRCHFSGTGDVAWFSAILDDCYRWDGEPGCWQDTRWTGVLEKQEGKWIIQQMHFSFGAH
ncbi:MAG: nuclear transport factor 2 family protein, partial [bacterium]